MKLPLWRRGQDEELDQEIESHLQMAVRDRVERGEPIEMATLAARREFGNRMRIKEATREVWGWTWIEQLWQDVHFAWRLCLKSPAFTAAAVLSIALGIGSNTTIFTLLDAVLFKQLPISEPEQLLLFNDRDRPDDTAYYAYPDYLQLRSHSDVLEGLAARAVVRGVPIAWHDASAAVMGAYVSASYFDVLRIPAELGRTISPADDSVGAPPVVMLGHTLWTRRFGGDPNVLGQIVHIANRPFTIIGIASARFVGLSVGLPDELLIPINGLPSIWPDWDKNNPRSPEFQLIGRLRPGVSSRQAESVLTTALQRSHATIAPTLTWRNPRNRVLYLERAITLASGSRGIPDDLRRQFSSPLLALMALVALVLGIACANVANLLLARATARQREIEVRVALGAGRARLVRQFATESLLLAAAGGALGVIGAWWSCQWIVGAWSLGDGRTPLLVVSPDLRVLGFTVGLSTLSGLVFGVVPVISTVRQAAVPSMRSEGGAAEPRASKRLRRVLIVSQVGFAMVLLAAAGLFGRTLWNLQRVETGIDRTHVLLFKVWTQAFNNADPASRNQRHVEVQQRVEAIPGVRAVAFSMQGSFRPGVAGTPIWIDDRPPDLSEPPTAVTNLVTSRYFETLGIPLVSGRTWSSDDDAKPPAVKPAVINQTAARLLFGESDPLGRLVRFSMVTYEVVGIVQDARFLDLRETLPALFGLSSSRGEIMAQSMYVRTHVDPGTVITGVQRVLQDSYGIVNTHVQTLDRYTTESTARERIVAGLSGVLGGMAALLTAVGLFGVITYSVARRTHEIGVRIALGAGRSRILRLVMGEVFLSVTVGLVVGLLTAVAVTRFASSLLYGVSPTDAMALATAAGVMCGVAALASYLPARRALSNDPVSSLRCD